MTMKGRGRWTAAAALAVAAAVLVVAPAEAQGRRGLTFVGGISYQDGGPGPGLVDALMAGGMGDIKPGTCAGALCEDSTYFPLHFSEGIGLAVTLGFRYQSDGPLSLEVLASNGQRGHAEGFQGQPHQNTLIISYNSYVLGSNLGVTLGPVRVGAGPALLFTRWTATENFAIEEKSASTSMGAGAGISYDVPLATTILSIRATYLQFGAAQVPNSLDVPIETDYSTFEVGITVNPRID